MVTPETLLALGLIAVYLFDSMHFLRIGELVVVTRGGELRGISFGSGFELGGRRPFLPNPLTPFWPALRAEWVDVPGNEADVQAAAGEMSQRAAALGALGILSTACTACVVIGAPAALLLRYQLVFIGCVLLCVACALVAAIVLLLRRQTLGLKLGECLSLGLVAIVCLPCSGNLARAVAKARNWKLPAYQIARIPLTGANTAQLREQLREALLRARRYVDEGGVEYRRLSEQLRLLEEGP